MWCVQINWNHSKLRTQGLTSELCARVRIVPDFFQVLKAPRNTTFQIQSGMKVASVFPLLIHKVSATHTHCPDAGGLLTVPHPSVWASIWKSTDSTSPLNHPVLAQGETGSIRLANPASGVQDGGHLVFTGNMLAPIWIDMFFTPANNATHSTTSMESSLAHDTMLLLMSPGNLSVETITDAIVARM